jgi:hypothetical protein
MLGRSREKRKHKKDILDTANINLVESLRHKKGMEWDRIFNINKAS